MLHEDRHFGNSEDPGCLTPFALRREGDILYLKSAHGGLPTGLRQEQEIEYIARPDTSETLGRYVKSDGSFDFVRLSTPTPGEANSYPWIGSVVISEIMCALSGFNFEDQYIELYNTTAQAAGPLSLEVNGYWITDFSVPGNSRMLVVVNPSVVPPAWPYGLVPADVKMYPGLPGLSRETGSILLRHGPMIIDRVIYSDGSQHWNYLSAIDPWPRHSSESHASLTRIDPTRYGNDPTSWQLAAPSPGR